VNTPFNFSNYEYLETVQYSYVFTTKQEASEKETTKIK
jgi:hypothetical protein